MWIKYLPCKQRPLCFGGCSLTSLLYALRPSKAKAGTAADMLHATSKSAPGAGGEKHHCLPYRAEGRPALLTEAPGSRSRLSRGSEVVVGLFGQRFIAERSTWHLWFTYPGCWSRSKNSMKLWSGAGELAVLRAEGHVCRFSNLAFHHPRPQEESSSQTHHMFSDTHSTVDGMAVFCSWLFTFQKGYGRRIGHKVPVSRKTDQRARFSL